MGFDVDSNNHMLYCCRFKTTSTRN